ncbi:MAG: Plug domain-containing protein, partial [Comamonas sp.]|nr:Plug domain-containing protein [Comamonas sp.]
MRPALLSPSSLGVLGLFVAINPALEAAPLELGQVLIEGRQQNELDAAQERLRQVPGATNLVDMQQVEQGRVASNEDVLAYQPGVFAQSAGNDGVKLSIRGSGINRAPGSHGSGVYVMFDGLPLTGP